MEKWQNSELIKIWILIALLFTSILLTFITLLVRFIYKKIALNKISEARAIAIHQKDLLESTIIVQEKERKRIAADIHDALISKLLSIKIKTEQDYGQKSSTNLIDESIMVARNISHDLSPPLIEYRTLEGLIDEVIEPIHREILIKTRYDIRNHFEYSNDFKIQFVRIFQESITNILKHANATLIHLHLRQSNNGTIFQIKDNGKGFNLNQLKKGLGLKNIETRVQYLKGKYRINSNNDNGTCSLFLFNNYKLN